MRNNNSYSYVDASNYQVSAIANKKIAATARPSLAVKRDRAIQSSQTSQITQSHKNLKLQSSQIVQSQKSAKAPQTMPRRVQNGMSVGAPVNNFRRQFVNQLKATNPRLSVKSALPITRCSNGGCGSCDECTRSRSSSSGSCSACDSCGSTSRNDSCDECRSRSSSSSSSCDGGCDSCGRSSSSSSSDSSSCSDCEKCGTRCDPISFGNQSFCDVFLGCAQAIPLLGGDDSIPAVGQYPIQGGAIDQALGNSSPGSNGIDYIAANSTSTCSGSVLPQSSTPATPAGYNYENGTITFPVVQNGCSASITRFFFVQDTCQPPNSAVVSRTVCWTVDANPPTLTVVNWQGEVHTGSGTELDPYVIELGCQNHLPNGNGQTTATGILQSLVVTATDPCACNGLGTSLSIGPVQDASCGRSIVGTWSAEGTCETGYLYVEITWIDDSVAPVITLGPIPGCQYAYTQDLGCFPNVDPTDAQIDCALGMATATDGCGGEATVVVTQNPYPNNGWVISSNDCGRTITRSWSATDQCGNVSTISRSVHWVDNDSRPIIKVVAYCDSHVPPTVPPTIITETPQYACDLGCNPCAAAIDQALGSAVSSMFQDACGYNVDVSCDTPPPYRSTDPDDGCRWFQTRTWTAVDACGNTVPSLSNTVSWIENTTPPVISISGYNDGDLVPLELCNPSEDDVQNWFRALQVQVSVAPCNPSSDSVSVDVMGDDEFVYQGCTVTRTRTWKAVDACGNTSFFTLSISYTEDAGVKIILTGSPLGNPVVPGQDANVSYTVDLKECNPDQLTLEKALGSYMLLDSGCGDSPIVTIPDDQYLINPGPSCVQTAIRTFQVAATACQPAMQFTRTVRWIDSNPPELQLDPTKIINCCSFDPLTSFDMPVVVDECGNSNIFGSQTPTLTWEDSTTKLEDGSVRHVRTYSYTDGCGNTTTATQTIRVSPCDNLSCQLVNGANRRSVQAQRQQVQRPQMQRQQVQAQRPQIPQQAQRQQQAVPVARAQVPQRTNQLAQRQQAQQNNQANPPRGPRRFIR